MAEVLDEKGLAAYLGVSPDWVAMRVKRREIPFTRLPGGRLVRFTLEQVAEILAAGVQPALNGPLAAPRLSIVPKRPAPSTRIAPTSPSRPQAKGSAA